jgi:hypothetical protein
MDKDLQLIMTPPDLKAAGKDSTSFRMMDDASGEIEIERPEGNIRYALKPLDQLYGQGYGVSSLDMKDRRFLPLLMVIETEIVNHYRAEPSLTDGLVALSLSKLSMNPAADCGDDVLCRRIQLALRLCLSLNDYSRQEVKLTIRKVAQSVERHTSLAGRQGYLTFIDDFIP